jgi:hypothetical protein
VAGVGYWKGPLYHRPVGFPPSKFKNRFEVAVFGPANEIVFDPPLDVGHGRGGARGGP